MCILKSTKMCHNPIQDIIQFPNFHEKTPVILYSLKLYGLFA